MRYLSEELNVFNILTAYNAVVSHIEGSEKYNKGLCIIVVDTVKRNINIKTLRITITHKQLLFTLSLKNTVLKIKDVRWLWYR